MPSRCWSTARAVGSQPERCRSSKRLPNVDSCSEGMPAAESGPMAIGLDMPGMMNRSPFDSEWMMWGASSRYFGSMYFV